MADPSPWLVGASIASAAAAWTAALFAFITSRNSRRALRIAEQQELRRQPSLALYLDRAYQRANGSHEYGFLVSVSNRSDSDDALARIDLRIRYKTRDEFVAFVDVPSARLNEPAVTSDGVKLETPARVDAHQTVAGWVYFSHPTSLLADCLVDDYSVIITDSHGVQTALDTVLIQEIRRDAETPPSQDPHQS
jgi:hypothetical protein